jgi:hypothetical protein
MHPVAAVEQPECNVRRKLVRNVNLSTSIPGSIGLSSYKFMVEIFHCLCSVIFIVQLVKLNGQACYFKFVQDYLEQNPHGSHDLLRTFIMILVGVEKYGDVGEMVTAVLQPLIGR